MKSLADELLLANERFYDAFSSLSLEKMRKIWHPTQYVKCLHPGWHILSGIDDVMESWRMIFRSTTALQFELEGVEAVVLGRVGIVTLREHLLATNYTSETPARAVLAATNVFEFSDDGWKMILHQAGPTDSTHNSDEEHEDDSPV
ncbi:MAG: nuclear transport factor 2 family protein [Candidatus Thermochlorobacter sp.]